MYLTPERYRKIVNLPISLAETELGRGRTMHAWRWTVVQGEKLELQSLSLHVVKILTPGVLPVYLNTALGAVSVGLYFGQTLTSPIAWASVETVGSAMVNPFATCRIVTPGLYTVIVANNTANTDVAVCATGVLKLYAQ